MWRAKRILRINPKHKHNSLLYTLSLSSSFAQFVGRPPQNEARQPASIQCQADQTAVLFNTFHGYKTTGTDTTQTEGKAFIAKIIIILLRDTTRCKLNCTSHRNRERGAPLMIPLRLISRTRKLVDTQDRLFGTDLSFSLSGRRHLGMSLNARNIQMTAAEFTE